MLRALRYRNYRLFFGGQILSLVGTWITTTATSWLVNAFDMPARQSFLIQMIDNKEDLGNAIALNSSMVNVADGDSAEGGGWTGQCRGVVGAARASVIA